MSTVGPPRGVLRHPPSPGRFHHARLAPPRELAPLVQHYWIVRWNLLGGPPQIRETLPHPNVHLVVEERRAWVCGIHGGRFTRELAGRGGVFGIKLRAGAFRPWLGYAVSRLRDRRLPLEHVLGLDSAPLVAELAAAGVDDEAQAAAASRFLLAHGPPPCDAARQVAAMVERIEHDRGLTRVEQVAACFAVTPRTLQRLFNEYVGIGPKWVIKRYRMHEVVERLAGGGTVDWTRLAHDLGYADQAHFIRDFRQLIGQAPGEYVRR